MGRAERTLRTLVAAVASAAYAVSFFLPAFHGYNQSEENGAEAFVRTFAGFPAGWMAWSANPLLWWALVETVWGSPRRARHGITTAVCIAAMTGMFAAMAAPGFLGALGFGYWVLLGSIIIVAWGSVSIPEPPKALPAAYPVSRSPG